MRCAAIGGMVLLLTVRLFGQSPQGDARFEVASIKPIPDSFVAGCQPPTCYPSYWMFEPNRFRAIKLSVFDLVSVAYSIPTNRVVGPGWAQSERYDVTAPHGLPASESSTVRLMLQRLLEERFSLRLHREQRPMSVYVLKKARDDGRLGPRLLSIDDCSSPPTLVLERVGCGNVGVPSATTRVGRGRWADFGPRLTEQLVLYVDGRPVVDETELSGWFEMRLDWSDNAADSKWPPLFTALREQLGLKLEAAQRPLEVLVLDSVERPTPN